MSKLISVIIPAFNEEEVIHAFHSRMSEVFDRLPGYRCEMIFVDDGSVDSTRRLIMELAASDPRVCAVALSRNFGKEAAMTAGLDVSKGDAVAIFDVDLQDPPELLLDFVENWEKGFDVVYAKRTRRDGETWLKKATAAAFYRVIRRLSRVSIPPDTGDCRLMTRRVVEQLVRLREHHRFMKGLFAWVGFPSVAVEYRRDPRVAGATKFNYWKLWNFALEGITSFTIAPLKIAMYVGFTLAAASFVMGGWIVVKTLIWGEAVPGYPTLIVTVLCLGGVQLFFIGVLGEYLGRIFGETKQRPLYIVDSVRESRISADVHGEGDNAAT
ncbi:glycosyltransferase family 2 protein [Pseudomonas aeruginosa]|uniref:glycosyltransferase family 2 protein n=1 Tax=Pseudomonas aeruginosa TaxID=287 RepID=UPI00070CB753|nr:glycosyltransferase family 2 protein [Pseudomonas aeruginosa]